MRSWHSNSPLRHPLSVPVLLVALILAVYYPSLLSGIHPVDDPGLISFFSTSPPLLKIILPGNGFYYRPIIELSFYLDNLLWGLEPGIMHVENILLHCTNAVLVYYLARRILVRYDNETQLVSLMAALLFALHPVNVESVAWIAGRTDPLLTMFVLFASYYWLNWLEKPGWQSITVTLMLFAAALLTKETAITFIAVAFLLALVWPGKATGRQRFKALSIVIVPVLLLLVLVLVFRSSTSGLSRFLSMNNLSLVQSTWELLVALGFYVRKLIFPFPLNFAIYTVHPMYGLLGVLLLPVLWLVYRSNRLSGAFFISSVLIILPAMLVAVKQIAWTPFAERYLYLASAFFVFGLVSIVKSRNRQLSVALLTCIVILLCVSGFGSFKRNLLWKDSFSFFQDAVVKSPEFGSVYYSLGGELIKKGEYDLAADAFATADRLNKRVSMHNQIKVSIMGTMLAKGEYLKARTYFFQTFKDKNDAPADFLELLYKADAKRFEISGKKEKPLLAVDLLDTLDLLNKKKPDPFWLYRSGQISLILGDDVRSADFFHRSYSAAPADAHYKGAAKTNFLRLEVKK